MLLREKWGMGAAHRCQVRMRLASRTRRIERRTRDRWVGDHRLRTMAQLAAVQSLNTCEYMGGTGETIAVRTYATNVHADT